MVDKIKHIFIALVPPAKSVFEHLKTCCKQHTCQHEAICSWGPRQLPTVHMCLEQISIVLHLFCTRENTLLKKQQLSRKHKIKNKKEMPHGRTIPISNSRERGKFDTPNTQIHDSTHFWFDTGTSINSGGIKLVLSIHISPLREMMQSW